MWGEEEKRKFKTCLTCIIIYLFYWGEEEKRKFKTCLIYIVTTTLCLATDELFLFFKIPVSETERETDRLTETDSDRNRQTDR